MNRIGIIDIGSNSIHFILVRFSNPNCYEIIDDVKETVRLGDGIDNEGNLSEMKLEKTLNTIKEFKSICDVFKIKEIIAVATEAMRKANNSKELLDRVYIETGISIKIISGEEEAFYDYFGAINSLNIKDSLVVDLGGSSTEIIEVEDRNIKNRISIPYGAINVTRKFKLENKISTEVKKLTMDFFYEIFNQIPWLSKRQFPLLIGIGGSIKNIGNIQRNASCYPLNISHNFRIKSSDVLEIYNRLSMLNSYERKNIAGLTKDRSDIFLGAAAEISSLINYCGTQEIIESHKGLREGIIYEYMLKNHHVISDVLDFSLNNIIDYYNWDKKYLYDIFLMSEKMYSDLYIPIGKIPEDIRNIIKTACSIQYKNEKAFNFILNSRLDGLTHRELLMSAYAAASRRNGIYNEKIEQYKDILSDSDIQILKQIVLVLRLAEKNKGQRSKTNLCP